MTTSGKPASEGADVEGLDYYDPEGLSAPLYDVLEEGLIASGRGVCLGDVAYYRALAARFPGPILEIGAGTGRVTWPLARAGHHVVGVDNAPAMLRLAEAKRRDHDPETAARVRFIRADMRSLALDRSFHLIIVPHRTLNHLTEAADQRRALSILTGHLAPGGALVLHMLAPPFGRSPDAPRIILAPIGTAGHEMEWRVAGGRVDIERQSCVTVVDYSVRAPDGTVSRTSRETLSYRWGFRQEMLYLFELLGLEVEEERETFIDTPIDTPAPTPERDQIWLLRRRNGASASTGAG